MSVDLAIRQRLGDFELDVAFAGAESGVTALFGPSGAGKSATVAAIAGLARPEAGRIAIDGEPVFDHASGLFVPARRRRIGYVFQDGRLFPHLSVRGNLEFGAKRLRGREPRASFHDVVALLGLEGLLARRPANLSGGERQRVALGRALLAGPRLLLLDEPLAALDQGRKAEIIPFLQRLRDEAGIPIVYVSHAIDEVAQLADTVVVMNAGRVAAQGSVFDVTARLDLFPLTGRFEAGAVVAARIVGHDSGDGLSELDLGLGGGEETGHLWVPAVAAPAGSTIRLRIRARDVMLALDAPERISANNVLRGTVSEIRRDDGAYADVQVDVGAARLIARVTRRSLVRLGLAPGVPVFAVIKSVTVDRRMPDAPNVPLGRHGSAA
jgi:molybdate transport system ATP-binding protein